MRLTLEVPAGAGPGSQITFTGPNGDAYVVEVPAGCGIGHEFTVEIPDGPPTGYHAGKQTKAGKNKNKGACC
eukprot:NODE_4628_length_655_cov_302.706667.p4 GENE.NODE_4628_length_655_cov_302.706667~~NODE_4628_length_655_cov_302.706667.p4  ORF type:complete len:72 (+),score=5.64 NODE_4628_length_655_cov_302.706667:94-309(+)